MPRASGSASAGSAGPTDAPAVAADAPAVAADAASVGHDVSDASDAVLASRLRLIIGRLGRQLRRQQIGGLTPSQLSALATIEKWGPIRLGDLACRERVSPPTVTPCVASLERLGLVERQADPSDGRSALVAIGGAGSALLDRIRSERTAVLARSIGGLDPTNRRALMAALPALDRLVELDTGD